MINGFISLFKNKSFLVYFSLSTLVILITLSFYINLLNDTKDIREVKQQLTDELIQTQQEFNMLAGVYQIDAMVILNGDYERALEEYRAILPKFPNRYKDFLIDRIEQIENMIDAGMEDDGADYKDLLISQGRKNMIKLENTIDSLNVTLGHLNDSLNGEILLLKEELTIKDNKLGAKEKVEVLSFAGNKGVKIHYLGETEGGQANGGGVGVWSTGSIYRGDWKDNLRHGKGIFEWADGQKYEGEYVEGKRTGFGNYHWPSGERYEGEWKDDKRNGFGILYDMDGNIRFEGAWKDDKPAK
jgi:hypothetical protein